MSGEKSFSKMFKTHEDKVVITVKSLDITFDIVFPAETTKDQANKHLADFCECKNEVIAPR